LFSDTIEEHARRLEHVLERFERDSLMLQPAKCVFAKREVRYLGYVVSEKGISATPDKIKETRSFLGLASFYRRFIPKFADIAKPLTELTRKDVDLIWEERHEAAFQCLKDKLCSSEVLAYPDFKSEFILTTDASKLGVSGILSQVQNGVDRPICYASR
jgi:hypothetical protein